jgi:hypothetical protein
MSIDEAFGKWYARQDHSGLPWQTSRDELFNVFFAGWSAKAEAIKQTDLFPGSWDKDPISANEAAKELHPPCKRESVGSTPTVGSNSSLGGGEPMVTAEDIYGAYPRKVGRTAAIKAINKVPSKWRDGGFAMRKHLLERTKAFAAAVQTWPESEKKFCPHPATWFNRGSYDDNPAEWSRGQATSQFSKTY